MISGLRISGWRLSGWRILTPLRRVRRPKVWFLAVVGQAAYLAVGLTLDLSPWLVTPVALSFLLGTPTVLWFRRVSWPVTDPLERLLISGGLSLLALMAIGALWNGLGPLVGVARPLDRFPVLLVATAMLLLLGRRRTRPRDQPTGSATPLSGREQGLIALVLVDLVLVVIGAVRLNNNLSGTFALVAQGVAILVLLTVLTQLSHLRASVVSFALYGFGLALLLATSLRGWNITGHDIQREYRLLELTIKQGLWIPTEPRSAYNACLSVTVMPTILANVGGLPGLWVFKVIFQALFAICPVIVQRVSARITTPSLSVVAALYFCLFPTFMGDMPYLNRQEIAFLFLGLIILLVVSPPPESDRELAGRQRQRLGLILVVGIVLSHYSTNYVFLGWLAVGHPTYLLLHRVLQRAGAQPRLARLRSAAGSPGQPAVTYLLFLAVMVGATIIWTGPVTGSSGQLQTTLRNAVASVTDTGGPSSSDVRYNIFSRTPPPTAQQRLDLYRADTLKLVAKYPRDRYPASETEQARTEAVPEGNLPLTSMGAWLVDHGVPAPEIVRISRSLAAGYFQAALLLGLVLIFLRRASVKFMSIEVIALLAATVAALVIQIALPVFTVDYGLLRAFQQSLFLFAPVMALGVHAGLSWISPRFAWRAQVGIVAALATTMTGVLPQVVGGYPAQLHLNNAGEYYDIYYLHDEEVLGIQWLTAVVKERSLKGPQSAIATDRYSLSHFEGLTDVPAQDDLFPTLLRPSAFVFLGATTAQRGLVTVFYSGDLVTYRYPMDLLDREKDIVYANSRIRIYR